ncbi:helix-hairpin-helix domain-containing protein [Anaerovorax odorimutans]|uniref:Helix-hairpin-helix domain-containing protein n=1 Tax=Anaerovorax odorimutans TaxID=109327 RepID=A0ABT1RKW8_9FIRM|nr:helix-hairpin-helix domain-containing protein [Anaerovorax odorimutans]MCQ4635829.1 helix-hairpin-helix domain-containing protein [Anaerovorax odorimutans]
MKQYLNKEFLLSNKKILIKVAAIAVIIAAAFFVFVLGGDDGQEKLAVSESAQQASVGGEAGEETEEPESIIVDVGGAVNTPQVVELKADSRVADAVSAAGGLKSNADTAGINQAAFLSDGEKVYIPAKGEDISGIAAAAAEQGSSGEQKTKVNINTATAEELQTLNGVGPATAEKIMDYRKNNGYFKKPEDLKNVSGIGDKTFEKLKEQIMV